MVMKGFSSLTSSSVFLLSLWVCAPVYSDVAQPGEESASAKDSGNEGEDVSLQDLESKVRSTLMFGGSSPVSFSGEARLKIQEHYFTDVPTFLATERTWTQSNWEGNESLLRLGLVVRPGRNVVLWSKLGFQHTMPGNFLNKNAGPGPDGFSPEQNRHDKLGESAVIHEDMSGGIAIRTIPASFWLRMGNILWTEASPFTIWKSQPRTFAWDYLPFEVEQPISRYYEYNIAKGEKTGRAAWNKKAFNGVNLESINLPAGLYLNLVYGTYERYDNFEREFVDWSNDLGYANVFPVTEAKQRGVGDSYRHLIHGRAAQEKALGDLTLGLNYVGTRYQRDILLLNQFRNTFNIRSSSFFDSVSNSQVTYLRGAGFYKEPDVYSIDLKGALNPNLDVHTDIAVGYVDTTWFRSDSLGHSVETSRSPYTPALYGRVNSRYGLPVQADVAWIGRGFYSPFSFAAPNDAFIPFGSNLVGAGKFIARGEGSPYVQNMAGMNLVFSPNVGYGHFKVAYGQHFQIEEARDLLYFPHRLNGQDLNSVIHSSYNRWGNNLIDHSLGGRYEKRLGDESYKTREHNNPHGPEAGGLRSDYLAIFEGFVPYESVAQADANTRVRGGVTDASPSVPKHKKWTFNFEMDGAYDVGPWVGYGRDLFLSAYLSLNGISNAFQPIAFDQKSSLLWGAYFRFEPAMALTEKFYVLALGGYETWKSDMAYMLNATTQEVEHVPLNYQDWSYGIGFDWDFASRIGLHARYKWMKHEDVNFETNNWTARLMSAEVKMWF